MGIFCYDHVKEKEANLDELQLTRPYEKPTTITALRSTNFDTYQARHQPPEPTSIVSCNASFQTHQQHQFQIPEIFVNGKKVFG